ncbi:hypothetical protein HerbRD11066_42510 [Herbidospora sp. RD11066]
MGDGGAVATVALLMNECLSPHPGRAQEDQRELMWRAPVGDRPPRVIEWTCDCLPTVYELCESGGQAYLRRTSRGKVEETPRVNVNEGRAIWSDLLAGRAQ